MDTIYVFCPDGAVADVLGVLNSYKINFVINDYSISRGVRGSVCHYDADHLERDQQNFLINLLSLGVDIEPLLSFIDRNFGFTEIKLLKPRYFLHQRAFSILYHRGGEARKRFLDWLLVFGVGFVALPICLITALAIRMESKGPIFFTQLRTGRFNKEFQVIKFRSMRIDAEEDGAKWASENDDRVTRVGRFIRKTRIDELPQIINVIRGEMSFVGPRPEREVFIKDLEKVIPYYRFRHAVRPGITGLAQVKYPYGASVEDAEWKHRYDMYYIKHRRFWLDVKIILLTVKVVLFGMGR